MKLKRIEADVVDEAPAPALAWFQRADHGVLRVVEVLRRVLVLRVVAASDVAAA